MRLSYIWWWDFSSGALENVQYPFIAINPKSCPGVIVPVMVSSIIPIALFKYDAYSIKPCAKKKPSEKIPTQKMYIWTRFPNLKAKMILKGLALISQYYLPTAGEREQMDSCLYPMVLTRRETQTASSRIWTQFADFIFYDDNHYAKRM